jgi:hypothetical protein
MTNQETIPKELQKFANWFSQINNVMNKNNSQYMIDMYWNNKQMNINNN